MKSDATAAVLIIGNEILSGKTQDANLQFMALGFARLGIKLAEARVIRDEPNVIAAVVNELRARHTYLFTTGGIGPTHDDLTAESIARAFGVRLVIDEEARRRIASSGRELNQARLKMAMVPEGASLIDNSVSLAPGFRIGNVFVLAGVPSIARAMFAACEPALEGGSPILSESIDVYQREGDFAAALEAIAKRYPAVDIGSYPFSREGRLGASLVVRGTDAGSVAAAMAEIRTTLAPKA
jgi:molybdenum cofactor synthesis domain-containing protein